MFVDSHCHLSFPELAGDLAGVLARMQAARVEAALNVCTTLEEFPRVLAAADSAPNLYASAGVHPDTTGAAEPTVADLLRLAEHPKVVAIGETGLDYYRLPEPLEWQRGRFRVHIRAARACGKPLIIHTRAAAADTLRLMREEGADQVGGVMHCFTETAEVAHQAMDLGFQGFNAASSANIPAQNGNGDLSGTITVDGKVDQGSSDNKNMTLNLTLVEYSDTTLVEQPLVYDTAPPLPILTLSLKKIPNGTLDGTLNGTFDMTGELEGVVALALTIAGQLEPDPADATKVRRKPGTVTVTGTASSPYGTFAVDVSR